MWLGWVHPANLSILMTITSNPSTKSFDQILEMRRWTSSLGVGVGVGGVILPETDREMM